MKRLLTYGLVAGILALASCRESETVYIYPPGAMNDAQDFVSKFAPQKQYFTLSTSELPRTLTLNNGSLITIQQNSIRKNGNYITGTFHVEALELLKRSDYIISCINTNYSNGKPMHMDGILQVDILTGNKLPVDQTLANVMDVRIPTAQGAGHVKITYGDVNFNGSGFTAWGPGMADVFSDANQIAFSTLQIGWISSGVLFRDELPTGNLTVELNGNPGELATSQGKQGNTLVYFCPKGSSVAMQVYDEIAPDRVHVNNKIPVGVEGKVIAFSIRDRKFYYSEVSLSTTANTYAILDMEEVPVDVLLTSIRELDSY